MCTLAVRALEVKAQSDKNEKKTNTQMCVLYEYLLRRLHVGVD